MAAPPGVDVHAHFFPESSLRRLEREGAAAHARMDRSSDKGILRDNSARLLRL